MTDAVVQKIIARNGEREFIDSSYEEYVDFLNDTDPLRFEDEDIISIKFVFKYGIYEEESSWFVNPYLMGKYNADESVEEKKFVFEEFSLVGSEFIPEILLLPVTDRYDVFDEFYEFYNSVLGEGLSEQEKYERFITYLENLK